MSYADILARIRLDIKEALKHQPTNREAIERAMNLLMANGVILNYEIRDDAIGLKMTEAYATRLGDALVADGTIASYAYMDGGLSVELAQTLESVTLTLNVTLADGGDER